MVIRVMGGLGNQMFQYALYKKMIRLGRNAALDDRELRRHGNQHNGLELEKVFGLKYRKINHREIRQYNCWRVMNKLSKALLGTPKQGYRLIDDLSIPFEKILNGGYKYLFGYWQEAGYFNDIRQDLLKDFSFIIREDDTRNKELAEKMLGEISVSIHVRRGDYLLNQSQAYICPDEYYECAINYMRNKYSHCRLYIFTDDLKWTKSKFGNLNDSVIVDWNQGEKGFLDMFLMTKCQHNIIAASTFSWWGAWLNQNPSKIVICPRKWYHNMNINPSLAEWIHL